MQISLPNWLYAKLEDSGPGAYGALKPELRAHLKSQIAFLHSCLGESQPWLESRQPWLDLDFTRREQPLDWVLLAVDEDYASAPGLIAAALPALLAGCGQEGCEVIVCRICKNNAPQAVSDLPLPISAALELLGLEQVFALNKRELADLLADLAAIPAAQGRVVLLGDEVLLPGPNKPSPAPALACSALPEQVLLLLDPEARFDLDLLRWAQPKAKLVECAPEAEAALHKAGNQADLPEKGCWSALVSARPEEYSSGPRLCLAPGNEAFWLWPELTPALFRKRQARLMRLPQ